MYEKSGILPRELFLSDLKWIHVKNYICAHDAFFFNIKNLCQKANSLVNLQKSADFSDFNLHSSDLQSGKLQSGHLPSFSGQDWRHSIQQGLVLTLVPHAAGGSSRIVSVAKMSLEAMRTLPMPDFCST
jgi:hypothetical protein